MAGTTFYCTACTGPRSQHSNRDVAWKRLRSRLYDHEMRKRMEEQQKLEDTKTDVGWGHQIRSYVLDQSRIKDLRTGVEIPSNHGLDPFIEVAGCSDLRTLSDRRRGALCAPRSRGGRGRDVAVERSSRSPNRTSWQSV